MLPLTAHVSVHQQGGNVLFILKAELAQKDALFGLKLINRVIAVVPRLAPVLPDHTLLDATSPHITDLIVLVIARGFQRLITHFGRDNI